MYYAYNASPILEQLPLTIESIACYRETLLVGTQKGHLLVYTVEPVSSGSDGPVVVSAEVPTQNEFQIVLKDSKKAFSKKPIVLLQAIQEAGILVSLSDGIICVHDLNTFAPLDQLFSA
eukprot:Sdes_comp24748_c0_seq1m22508